MYDFDCLHDRRGSGCVKWDTGKRIFSGGDDFIPMWIADSDFATLPEIPAAIEARLSHPLFGYCTEPPKFFESLRGWLQTQHDFQVERDWIVPADGVLSAASLAIHAHTAPGDAIVVQTPCYDNFYKLIERSERKVRANPLHFADGRFTMDYDDLEQAFREGAKTLLFCNPHNPSGRVWQREELTRVADLCIRYDVRVISDDIHCDLALPGSRYVPLVSVREEMRSRTITCYAPGKTFNMPSLKAAAAVIPDPAARQALRDWQERIFLPKLNVLSYEAFAAAYTHGADYAAQLRDYIAQNAAVTLDFLATQLPEIRPVAIEGTYLMLWDCTALGLYGRDLVQFFAKEAGVAFSDGASYGPSLRGWVRVNLGCPRARLEQALQRVAEAVRARRDTDGRKEP